MTSAGGVVGSCKSGRVLLSELDLTSLLARGFSPCADADTDANVKS